MTQAIDVKLTQGEDGVYDIGLDANGELELDYGFGTTIGLSISGERRATAAEVPTPENRRGWIGNILSDIPGFEAGSKLWLLKQARLTPATVTAAKNYTQDALQWMIDDGFAKTITVTAEQQGVSKIVAAIDIDGEVFYYDVWNNTVING